MGLQDMRPMATPMEPSVDLRYNTPSVSLECLNSSEITQYCKTIGLLMCTTIRTCPDISFVVSTLLCFMETPRSTHWKAILWVFKYLKGMWDLRLIPGRELTGYSDPDCASQINQHSISGFTFFIGDGAVSWGSKKQLIITLSSIELEICCTHPFCPRDHMAPQTHFQILHSLTKVLRVVQRQPEGNYTLERIHLWHWFPFYSTNHQFSVYHHYLLSHWRHDSRHIHQVSWSNQAQEVPQPPWITITGFHLRGSIEDTSCDSSTQHLFPFLSIT